MSFMVTATGIEYHFTGPDSVTETGRHFRIEDIAHHLAQLNRFTGACKRPYSVAEHSLLCSEIAERGKASRNVQLAALMHDAHEAYTADLSSPAKRAVNQRSVAAGGTNAWTVFETEHEKALRLHFGISTVFTSYRLLLRSIDLRALATERRDLMAWRDLTHSGWEVLGDGEPLAHNRHEPIDWLSLDTPSREAMSWNDWRKAFLARYEQLTLTIKANHRSAA